MSTSAFLPASDVLIDSYRMDRVICQHVVSEAELSRSRNGSSRHTSPLGTICSPERNVTVKDACAPTFSPGGEKDLLLPVTVQWVLCSLLSAGRSRVRLRVPG